MRYKARVDANHAEIVKALRDAGASVQSLAPVGGGVPDLLVGFRGATHLLEVKNPKTRKVGGRSVKDTKDRQAGWHESWRGATPARVYTVEEALKAIGL